MSVSSDTTMASFSVGTYSVDCGANIGREETFSFGVSSSKEKLVISNSSIVLSTM